MGALNTSLASYISRVPGGPAAKNLSVFPFRSGSCGHYLPKANNAHSLHQNLILRHVGQGETSWSSVSSMTLDTHFAAIQRSRLLRTVSPPESQSGDDKGLTSFIISEETFACENRADAFWGTVFGKSSPTPQHSPTLFSRQNLFGGEHMQAGQRG